MYVSILCMIRIPTQDISYHLQPSSDAYILPTHAAPGNERINPASKYPMRA